MNIRSLSYAFLIIVAIFCLISCTSVLKKFEDAWKSVEVEQSQEEAPSSSSSALQKTRKN